MNNFRRKTDYFHLFMIYVIWATSYLVMKAGIEGAGAFGIFQLQSLRLLLGGGILLFVALLSKCLKPVSPGDLFICAVAGALFWVFGNGGAFIAVAEYPSSFVVMAMGTIPLWSAAYEFIFRKSDSTSGISLLLGFIGLGLILYPAFSADTHGLHASLSATLALFYAPIAWVVATQLQNRLMLTLNAVYATGLQLVFGGGWALLYSWFAKETWPSAPSTNTLLSLLYLGTVISAATFFSYVRATAIFSKSIVSCFAYINPVVGIFLGWLFMDEQPPAIAIFGMVVVLSSVAFTLVKNSTQRSLGDQKNA
ncbi:DMT family transporter [Pseudomonas frederiksbergensis]|uniref:EamA domain-containing protein n=1 Tax=Pseudomonas frederiksbergensis TaxID=104087 RepID=A0A0B1YS51_9PSED|nr:EamA family transporter [Pseudomonas frederiksbergensis]KHK61549.1 hypothetical protein JZ00_27820 [Pseudomonas frederiksbergensis]